MKVVAIIPAPGRSISASRQTPAVHVRPPVNPGVQFPAHVGCHLLAAVLETADRIKATLSGRLYSIGLGGRTWRFVPQFLPLVDNVRVIVSRQKLHAGKPRRFTSARL